MFGSILAGAVHDYMSGMISSRHGGASIAELSGVYLGKAARWVMRIFSVVLLILCGTVFVNSPAALIARLPLLGIGAALPAAFMSAVSMTYILMADEGFGLSAGIAYPVGAAFAGILFILYGIISRQKRN